MSKTNIKCPRCHPDKLYKFSLNNQANKKYQCRQYKRQFTLDDGNELPKINYPKYLKCGKGTYLHHSYKHYNCYKCNHIVVKRHTTNIDDLSNTLVTITLSMKGIRFPLHVILNSLTLYFLNNSSTKSILNYKFQNQSFSCHYSKFD